MLSRLGVVGTPDSAALPALLAATGPDSRGDEFFGPRGPGGVSGGPALQALWRPLRSTDDVQRLTDVSERLVGRRFPD